MPSSRFKDFDVQTPEEVLEAEIRDLEQPLARSWVAWIFGGGALVVLAAALWSLVFLEHGGIVRRMHAQYGSQINLVAPRGTVETRPTAFEWTPVEGARSYVVTIQSADGDTILTRPVDRHYLVPLDTERAYLLPGSYAWRVEARDAAGDTIAVAQMPFRIVPGPGEIR